MNRSEKMVRLCDDLGFSIERKKILVKEIVFKEKYPVALKERAEKYAKLMKKGKKFPPVMVFGKRYKKDTYQVFDGHARLLAHKINKQKKIKAEITLVNKKGRPIPCK